MYGRENDCKCSQHCVDSDAVKYTGPNLPGTGIQTNTNLTIALEMIDNEILLLKEALFNITTTITTTII